MRGNLPLPVADNSRLRSIPAHAGEPQIGATTRINAWVYPRACGGTSSQWIGPRKNWGLSPRMRGNPRISAVISCTTGSIPAHAGEPMSSLHSPFLSMVYPRACGGTSSTSRLRSCSRGLSPRMRGNRVRRTLVRAGRGSIPAHAGEPALRPLPARLPGVYPRACGGTFEKGRAIQP